MQAETSKSARLLSLADKLPIHGQRPAWEGWPLDICDVAIISAFVNDMC